MSVATNPKKKMKEEILGMAKMALYAISLGDWTPDKDDITIAINGDKLYMKCIVGYEQDRRFQSNEQPPDDNAIEQEEQIQINEELNESVVYDFVQDFLEESYLRIKENE